MKDLYFPVMAEITDVKQLTAMEKLFEITLPGGVDLDHDPGQFVELSLFGVGEAPFSISSSPTRRGTFELGIRNVGMLTDVLHRMEAGEKVGIRGPFGSGFNVDDFKGKDVMIIAGGIGLVPVRSLINYILDNRDDFGRLIILYGSKTEQDLLFTDELKMWEDDPKVEYHVTVDNGSDDWKGNTGVITTLIPGLDIDLANTKAVIVGPPIMYRFVLMSLNSKGLPEENIYMSLERRMKCGVGKCGHCQINDSYVCQDGPVYHYPDIVDLQEAL
jgi:sulfhydrogenase subunit gamma (sulfur reductase)